MEPVISGIQQVGVGVTDVYGAWEWYRRVLGFDVPIFDDEGVADRMQRYTGGQPQNRHAVLAVNMQGGGGLEIWQYTTRAPMMPLFKVTAGDLGVFELRIKTHDIETAFRHIKEHKADVLGYVDTTPEGVKAFHISDPFGNLIRIEERPELFMATPAETGGVIAPLSACRISTGPFLFTAISSAMILLFTIKPASSATCRRCRRARSITAACCSAAQGSATGRFCACWARRRSSCCNRSTARRTRS